MLLGGRGAGKTFAGAAWVLDQARRQGRIALVGPTLHDVREVMVEGPSGIRALAPAAERPRWEATRRRLVWDDTGAVASAFSAEDPDALRGPQHHAAWADELCAWREPDQVLAMLRMGLRLGRDPRLVVTTTPRPIPALRRLLEASHVELTRAGTKANAANLPEDFVAGLTALYGGTRLARQEIDGLLLEPDGALFRAEDLARARALASPAAYEAVVVAVDPPAGAVGDACGIVVAGRAGHQGHVLEDASVRGLSPLGWARRVVEAARRHEAQLILAEANQGGDMIRALLAQAGAETEIRLVHATRAKRARAEPVAALYEQGRIGHACAMPALEEELMALGSADGPARSPDRADALVWALTQLLLTARPEPRVRGV